MWPPSRLSSSPGSPSLALDNLFWIPLGTHPFAKGDNGSVLSLFAHAISWLHSRLNKYVLIVILSHKTRTICQKSLQVVPYSEKIRVKSLLIYPFRNPRNKPTLKTSKATCSILPWFWVFQLSAQARTADTPCALNKTQSSETHQMALFLITPLLPCLWHLWTHSLST